MCNEVLDEDLELGGEAELGLTARLLLLWLRADKCSLSAAEACRWWFVMDLGALDEIMLTDGKRVGWKSWEPGGGARAVAFGEDVADCADDDGRDEAGVDPALWVVAWCNCGAQRLLTLEWFGACPVCAVVL